MIRKNSIITDHNYKDESKTIYSELELIQEDIKFTFLKDAIEEGLKSGRAEDFNPQKYLESLKIKKRAQIR